MCACVRACVCVCDTSECSGETARKRMSVLAFVGRLCVKRAPLMLGIFILSLFLKSAQNLCKQFGSMLSPALFLA